MYIHLYQNSQIDKTQWDHHIDQCANSLIYAHSYYLDHMCPGWCALIGQDNQYFMPVPLRRKTGITYCYQPLFTQQLGIFFKNNIDGRIIDAFLRKAENISRDIRLHFNFANPIDTAEKRCNLIVDLHNPFEEISSRFRKDLITKPRSLNLKYAASEIKEVFGFYEQFILSKNEIISRSQFQSFQKLVIFLQGNDQASARKVISPEGKTLSAALFLNDHKRIYYMMAANTPEGKRSNANALLLYEAIREFSGQNKIFDFEGSEIPGVRFFFEKYGPQNQPYYYYRKSRLNRFEKTVIFLARTVRSFHAGK